MRPPPAHRATSAHPQAVYPFTSAGGLSGSGPVVGRDLFGGPFCFDPWELYGRGVLTNPNLLVLGQLGRGKSSFIKTYVWRQRAFGRQAWIVDPKGEYGPLARATGGTVLALAPGGALRLNPLDLAAAIDGPDERVRRRAELAASLVGSSLGRPLRPEERAALEMAVRRSSARLAQPTLGHLAEDLLEPDEGAAVVLGTDRSGLAADGRPAALEIRRMVQGDLAGMFDGPTSPGVDLAAGVAVVDLSATFSSPALPLVMICATAWLQSALAVRDGTRRVVVIDEAWAILADLATARWTQAAFKLARAMGVANVVVLHRVSDLGAAGADGSAQQKLADGLLADTETRVVYGQPASEAAETGRLLGLGRTETELLTRLPRGVALWQVAGRPHLVEHVLGPGERALVDTDAAMRGAPTGGEG